MSRTSEAELSRRELALLALVSREADASGEAVISSVKFCKTLEVSEQQLRLLLKRAKNSGFLVYRTRFAEDGGQLSNAWKITGEGQSHLADLALSAAQSLGTRV